MPRLSPEFEAGVRFWGVEDGAAVEEGMVLFQGPNGGDLVVI
jgi:hypothetical protein